MQIAAKAAWGPVSTNLQPSVCPTQCTDDDDKLHDDADDVDGDNDDDDYDDEDDDVDQLATVSPTQCNSCD